eukprot:g11358.t1
MEYFQSFECEYPYQCLAVVMRDDYLTATSSPVLHSPKCKFVVVLGMTMTAATFTLILLELLLGPSYVYGQCSQPLPLVESLLKALFWNGLTGPLWHCAVCAMAGMTASWHGWCFSALP